MSNLLMMSDSYKYSHPEQLRPGTTHIHSYAESRGGMFDRTVFFGLQGFLHEYLSKGFTLDDIEEMVDTIGVHGIKVNKQMWSEMWSAYNRDDGSEIADFPVIIHAVPEGIVTPTRTPLLTIQNTDPQFPSITNFLETMILRAIWYPITVATLSYHCRQVIRDGMLKTCDTLDKLPFMLHDFGARGVSSHESAMIGGAAHLVNFMGSDTVEAIPYLDENYFTNGEMPCFSIPASEHSTMTSWGGEEGEPISMENMIDQFAGPGRLYACVSDSYDIINAVENIWGTKLKDKILEKGGTLVIRPDSQDPCELVPKLLAILGQKFGMTENKKGYMVLHPSVRLIWGDGINYTSLQAIIKTMIDYHWSLDNIAFGMGGALLQQVNRDTQKFAIKASAAYYNGEWIDVYKNPAGTPDKASKRGRQTHYTLMNSVQLPLEPVFENGSILRLETLKQIRNRITLWD